ncbi:MAG: DUF2277 domain-containing protein [Pseudomonadota bacterium]
MCRNIRTLYNYEPPASDAEIQAAALQFVRKVSGFRKPSQSNVPAFDSAVAAISAEVADLLERLQTKAAPKNREVEAQKRTLVSQARFATEKADD